MSYELHVLHAAADGVQPAFLLRAPGQKAEYLLNVPDGFSRLAMEHKLTPSARLSCVLLTSLLPASTSGLGGLILRLKHDGHGQVQVIGPQGSSSIMHSLRHIFRWQHPKVFVSECCNRDPLPVFEDEHIVIVPLLAGDQSTGCPWCLYASSSECGSVNPPRVDTRSELSSDSSSSDSSGSDSSSDETASISSTSDMEEDLFEKGLSAFRACVAEDSRQSDGASESEGLSGPLEKSNPMPAGKGSPIIDLVEVLPVSASGVDVLKSSVVESTKSYKWLLSNLHEADLPELVDDSNPVYFRNPPAEAEAFRVGAGQDPKRDKDGGHYLGEQNPARVLGYISYLRKIKTGVLFVDCRGMKDWESLMRHPALSCIYSTSGKSKDKDRGTSVRVHSLAATVHLTPQSLVQSPEYQAWMFRLISSAHVVINEGSPEFGFQSSLAMLQRLNNIHKDIFSLPFNMKPYPRTTQVTRVKPNSNITVDAELCMCLRFCEEDTTVSHACVHHSVYPVSLERVSSLSEASEQVPEQVLAKSVLPHWNRSALARSSQNMLAANEIRSQLLKQKEAIMSSGTVGQKRKTLSSDSIETTYLAMKCTDQSCVCECCLLYLATEGCVGSAAISHSQDDISEDVARDFNVKNKVATQGVVIDNQPVATVMQVSRNFDPMPQMRSLTPVEEYMKFHDPASEFQLTFLGTGCAEPSKKRGSSSILLQIRGAQGAMLLDGGEGAVGQLIRKFGERAARTVLSSLQCLWLSHKHGDHVLGVLSIIQARSTQVAPLIVFGPHKVGLWLSEVRDIYSARGYTVPQFTYIHCEELSTLEQRSTQQHSKQLLEVLDAMQLNSLQSVKVFHCHDAYGIVLRGRQGWKMVYSGDTRPCKQLVEAGKGCTLLIHEATFEDTLVDQAVSKRHSTVSEAVNVGRQMNACHVILTHFSQRYPEMVAIDGDSSGSLSLAFDGMVVPSHLLDLVGKLLPKIKEACEKTVKISPTTETQHGSAHTAQTMAILTAAGQQSKRSCLNISSGKHKRWSSGSDDEAAQCQDGQADSTSFRWSSGSDEEAESNELGGVQLRKNLSHSSDKGFFKLNSYKGGCGKVLDSFKERLGNNSWQRGSLGKNCQVDRASSYSRESVERFGGKHVRWTNSDSEDA